MESRTHCSLLVVALCTGVFACKSVKQRAAHTEARSAAVPVAPASAALAQAQVIPPDALRVLERSTSIELMVLDPSGARAEPGELGNLEFVDPQAGQLKFTINGLAKLEDPEEIAAVRSAIVADLVPVATAGWCFEPLHAIRATDGQARVVFAISYRCGSALIVGPSGVLRVGAASSGATWLNRVLGEHDVPLFRPPRRARPSPR